ncbi:hypothetical protein As57867_005326, partial [Aphanomyces stellatus]
VSPVQLSACDVQCGNHNDAIKNIKEFKSKGCTNVIQGSHTAEALAASTNGFVYGIMQAYNQHHNLELRPDDVWLAIMTQFGLFVNGNAEQVRNSLVKHEGKKTLTVTMPGTLHTANYGVMADLFVGEMKEHLVDAQLSDWILPGFSTTTHHDRIVGSVTMMAAMKKYFAYRCCLMCGIPNVTLLGTVEDWETIRSRADKLKEYGLTEWVDMLTVVLDQFVASAKGKVDVDFWQRICHHMGGGSGPSYLSGWITVFCVFNDAGKWQGSFKSYCGRPSEFPIVDTGDVPGGYLTVDVEINDNGVEYKTLMFAGHMAFEVKGNGHSIAPHLGWALALMDGST